jgi:hypothetical protein
MTVDPVKDLPILCEEGQSLLVQTRYLEAEKALEFASDIAWDARDFDTLSRLYMPLQEARRQRRQRCGEGTVCLDLIAAGPNDDLSGRRVAENYPNGQLLVAGWKSISPAIELMETQKAHGLYVESFLAAVYPLDGARAIVIVPTVDARLPQGDFNSIGALAGRLPQHCIVLSERDLPRGARPGTCETYAEVMATWERLHAPFLAAADAETDPLRKIEAYRRTIAVDYACELAHQRLSDVARQLSRNPR